MPEGTTHRRAFERYFRMGDERSIEKLQAALAADGDAPSLRTLYQWSSKFDWQARVDEIERAATDSNTEVLKQQVRDLNRYQAEIGRILQNRGVLMFTAFGQEDLTAAAALRAIDLGARLERQALGADRPQFIDITKDIRAMARREGLDPDQAVRDALLIIDQAMGYE